MALFLLSPLGAIAGGAGGGGVAGGGGGEASLLYDPFAGDVAGDPVSHLFNVAQTRRPTAEEFLHAFLFFHKMQEYEQIGNEYYRAQLKNKAGLDAAAAFAADLVIDTTIDLILETLKLNNWYGCTSSVCDEFAFRQVLVTLKSMAITYINPTSATVSFVYDTVEIQAESWKETKQALDMLPEKGELPEEYTEWVSFFGVSIIDLYDLKAVVDIFNPGN